MNFLQSLSTIFTDRETITVSRQQLADIAAPFITAEENPTNEDIAHGWQETAEWLRIGFDCESDKGGLYHMLHYSLRAVADHIKNAPPEMDEFEIKRSILEALKSSYIQLTQASHYLGAMSNQKANHVPTVVQDRHGNDLVVPFTQIYNRPGAAHDLMGMKLEDVVENFDKFFDETPVKLAPRNELYRYKPPRY